jgi:sterol desaturase/sphingolipid hydroxylase (fatty acid hydroxylase superfamily)
MTLAIVLSAILGALTWTFLEYVIHRFLGHDRRLAKKTPFGHEHTAHHSRGNYFAAWWKKAAFAVFFLAVVGSLAVLATGLEMGLAYGLGLVGFYLFYEVFHRLLHVWEGVGPYARWARRHHFHHHFHDPSSNHGVTSPLWDLIFGTRAVPGPIEVPPKLAMRWLVDPKTGDVHPHLSHAFRLRQAR